MSLVINVDKKTCIYMHVCVEVCMDLLCIHVCAHTYICHQKYIHAWTHIQTGVHVPLYPYVHSHLCMHAYIQNVISGTRFSKQKYINDH